MQAALLSVFCASGSGNLIRIKTWTKPVERGFLVGVRLLQPPACLTVPWGSTSTSWPSVARVGDGGCHTGVGEEHLPQFGVRCLA